MSSVELRERLAAMNRDDVIKGIQQRFRESGESLNERERRLWAARESLQIGRGSLALVSQALRMSPNTIKRGVLELAEGNLADSSESGSRIRRAGGGRRAQPAGNPGSPHVDRSSDI